MRKDVLWTVRWLRHHPLFAAALISILALGIGANTAVFSVVDAVLIRPLPYQSSDRLVRIEETTAKRPNIGITAAEYLEWRQRADLFASTAAYVRDMVTITGDDAPDQVWLTRVSPGAFPMLGVHAQVGQTLAQSDENTVVLSDRFWRRRFLADPRILGRAVTISGQVYTVAGVMAPGFEFPFGDTEMWAPLRLTGVESLWVNVAARLKEGVSISHAQAALDVIARRLEQNQPKEKAGIQVVVTPWREVPSREYELTLVFILGAVGLVLLIACSDVAGLLLTRAVQRRKEIAIRTALGAGASRLARQLLVESLILALFGSVAGVAIAQVLLQLLVRQLAALPITLPHLQTVTINHRVLLFNVVLCLLLALLVSLAPIWTSFQIDLQSALRSGRGSSGSKRATRFFSVLIGLETALAFLLLAGSGLMIRSLIRLQQADHGFHPDHVLTLRVPVGTRTSPRATKYETKQQQMAFYRELIDRLKQVPGVRAAAVVNNLPLSGATTSTPMDIPGGPSLLVSTRTISPQYFSAMGIPLISGRVFNDADQPPAQNVAIVNEYLARQLFPGQNPLGRPLPGSPPTIVVGVVKDAAQLSFEQPAKGELYRPFQQFIFGVFLSTIVVRTSGDPLALASTLRREIWSVDAAQPVVKVETMNDVIEHSIWRPRFSAWIFSILAGLALLLTLAGVYSVVAYTTTLRAQEVGIRVALGALPRDVVTLLMRDALIPLVAGLAVSVGASLLLARFLTTLLYQTGTADPVAYIGAGALLLAVGAIASARPAWRAATADPVQALRSE